MVKIDPKIYDLFKLFSGKPVPIIIVFDTNEKAILQSLSNAGIQITSRDTSLFGCLMAEISSGQIDALKTIPGIIEIEYDQDVKIL